MFKFPVVSKFVFLFFTQIILAAISYSQFHDQYWLSEKNRTAALKILRELLSFPNDAKKGSDINKNINWLQHAFQERGFSTRLLTSPAQPFLYAEKKAGPNLPVILFYMHFDGQPVSPNEWQQESPYIPVMKRKADTGWVSMNWDQAVRAYDPEYRVFARSASDDKGPVAMFLAAIDLLGHQNGSPAFTIKVILDSEEEKGSPNLPSMVQAYKELLSADQLVVLDGPRHSSNEPTLIFGCRGVAQMNLEVFGPRGDLHSGHFGNYAPNPAFELSSLLASMKDQQGQVLVPGFYDGIHVSAVTQRWLHAVPDKKERISQQIGIAREINPDLSYQEGLQFPSLNILNLSAGRPEAGTRNIVPSSAKAELDIRLVPGSNPVYLETILRKFVTDKGFHLIEGETPTEAERRGHSKLLAFHFSVSSQAFVTEPDSPGSTWIFNCTEKVFNRKPVVIRMAGGTVPIAPFIRELNIPAFLVPTVNPDNNQHAANENLRLGNYFEGVSLIKELLVTDIREILKK